jgi:acyl dehydratase
LKDSPRIFDAPPPLGPAWFRALTSLGKRGGATPTVPRLPTLLRPVRSDRARLAQYRALCGFDDSGLLPVTWPQVMAGPLHFHMVTDPSFPLPAAGVVHLRNLIEQYQVLRDDDPLGFECALSPAVATHRGFEIDLETRATREDTLVWRSVITFLSRRRSGGEKPTPSGGPSATPAADTPPPARTPLRSTVLRVPESMGRRYAAIAGDYNPIHQHALAARAFGFPRAIVHGMYTLARTVAECADDLPPTPFALQCAFRRPVFLPSTVVLSAERTTDGAVEFSVRSGETVCVDGTIRAL